MKNLSTLFQNLNVLIVGDVMIDRYMTGKVSRISPEAPVPVLDWQNTENRLGGAANVALNIKALGAVPHLVGIAGDDDDGLLFRALLSSQDIENQHIILVGNRPTTVKTRVLASGQQLLRLDKESTEDNDENTEDILLTKMKYLIKNVGIDVIIFQDYNKGLLTPTMIEKLGKLAQKHNIPTCVDPKKKNFWAYKGVTLFKPNLKEIREAMNETVKTDMEGMKLAAAYIKKHLNNDITLITLSEKGLFIEQNDICEIHPTMPRNIADVCGAGDSVISVVALALAAKMSMSDIALLANLAGGLVCEEIGVVPIRMQKLKQEYQHWCAKV